MTPDECIVQISRLLECFPGVGVVSAYRNNTTCKTYFRLRITSLQSLMRIVIHCQVGANVGVAIDTAGTSLHGGQPIDETSFRYYFTLLDDDYIQRKGVHYWRYESASGTSRLESCSCSTKCTSAQLLRSSYRRSCINDSVARDTLL